MTLAALARRLREGELTPREAVESSLERIERLDGELNAFISVRAEEALAEADDVSAAPERGPLWGVPVGVKDVIDVGGVATTAGSQILAGNVPSRDAAAVEGLRRAGAVIVGKLNTHEFAFGATTTSRHFGPCRNPWDLERMCGGSSGGSGAAVAAGLVPGTLGTDTAGSIRIPAAFCGVTGLRPSIGRVSNRGVVATSWSFDTVGPLAPTAEDCALLLEAIAGHDPQDPLTARVPVPRYASELETKSEAPRVGVLVDRFESDIDPRVAAAARAAVADLADTGARLVDVRAPELDWSGVAQQLLMLPEATAAHRRRLAERLPDYGADVRARLLTGLFLPATAPVTGGRARRWLVEVAERLFGQVDLLVAPAMPVVPTPLEAQTVELDGADVPYRLALIPFNSPWSFLGLPAASVPCGFVDGLPVALSVIGPRFGESGVLQLAHAFQKVRDWHLQRPTFASDAASTGKGV